MTQKEAYDRAYRDIISKQRLAHEFVHQLMDSGDYQVYYYHFKKTLPFEAPKDYLGTLWPEDYFSKKIFPDGVPAALWQARDRWNASIRSK